MIASREKILEEIDGNFEVFKAELPKLMKKDAGKFVLLHHGKILEVCSSLRDAYRKGIERHKDHLFSIQEVTDTPVDLGYFSHVVPGRQV